MEPSTLAALAAIGICAIVLSAVAAAEAAIERANDVRIQALAARGNVQARRIAGEVGHPG